MPLVPFDSVDRTTLRWLRTGETTPEFTLLAGESAVAVIRSPPRRGAPAVAETAHGSWVLERGGFLVSHLTVRREEGGAPIARLTNRLGHHEIEVGGGGSYRLRRAGLLLPSWSLSDAPGGAEQIHIEAVAEARRLEGGAVLATGAVPPGELLLLVVLSWYLVVLLWIEDEAIEALAPFEGPDSPAPLGRGAG